MPIKYFEVSRVPGNPGPGSRVIITSMLERFAAAVFYPFFLAAVSAVAAPVVGVKEGVTLSLAALAWFVFGRLLVNVYFCAVVRGMTSSLRLPLALGSVVVDLLGILVTLRIDPELIRSTFVAIAISEVLLWSLMIRNARSSPG